jgi:hypothetical protein
MQKATTVQIRMQRSECASLLRYTHSVYVV